MLSEVSYSGQYLSAVAMQQENVAESKTRDSSIQRSRQPFSKSYLDRMNQQKISASGSQIAPRPNDRPDKQPSRSQLQKMLNRMQTTFHKPKNAKKGEKGPASMSGLDRSSPTNCLYSKHTTEPSSKKL